MGFSINSNFPIKPEFVDSKEEDKKEDISKTPLEQLLSNITSGDRRNFQEYSDRIWEPILKENPEIQQEMEAFIDAHPEKISALREGKTWDGLKSELGVGMAKPTPGHSDGISWEQFRAEANQLMTKSVNKLATQFELGDHDWTASGTPGFDSDVDQALLWKNGGSVGDAFTLKTLVDTAHTHLFKGLSGTQLDTERYIPHSADLNTFAKLKTDKGKSDFVTSEIVMAAMQAKLALKDDQQAFEEHKEKELAHTSDPERKKIMREVFQAVDQWEKVLHTNIQKKMIQDEKNLDVDGLTPLLVQKLADKITEQDKEAYKRAALLYKTPILQKLACEVDKIQDEILKVNQQLMKLRPEDEDEQDELLSELDHLHIRQDVLYKMILCHEDESTISQSEGLVTLFKREGQVHARSAEKQVKTYRKKRSNQLKNDENLVEFQRSLAHLQKLQKEETQSVISQFDEPTGQDLILASYEREQQYHHVFQEHLTQAKNGDELGVGLIKSGKYAQRAARGTLRALEKFEEEGVPVPKKLMDEAKEVEHICTMLERCKRKQTLNYEATKEMLQNAIREKFEKEGKKLDQATLDKDLTDVLSSFQRGGAYYNRVMSKRDKMQIMLSTLQEKGYVTAVQKQISKVKNGKQMQSTKLLPKDEKIRKILQARVGYKRTKLHHSDLNPIHQEADRLTLKKLGLDTREGIKAFDERLHNLCQAGKNFAFDHGAIPNLSKTFCEEHSLSVLWNQLKK